MAGEPSDDRLQQYFDGELEAAEVDALRKELETDADLRAKLEGLAYLRQLIVAAADDQADDIDSEALFAGISARAAAPAVEDEESAAQDEPMPAPTGEPEPVPARPPLGVIPGGKKDEARPRRSNVAWIGVAATLALAAAVLLFIVRPWGLGGTSDPTGGLASGPPPGSEVVEVDFGYSTGAIFSVEGQEGERYAVVWISDEKIAPDDEGVERIQ